MVDLQDLKRAFGRFPTGVTVVTTRNVDGKLYGFTANSFTSVSLKPPLLLVCPGSQLSSRPIFDSVSHFAVNILAEGQETISNHFANFKGNRFQDTLWQKDRYNQPWIEGAAASFSCRTYARYEAGDHMILLGEVLDYIQSEQRGLGFLCGKYFNPSLEKQSPIKPYPAKLHNVRNC